MAIPVIKNRKNTTQNCWIPRWLWYACQNHLAGELKVSEDTIRRDLLDLDQKGQLKRVFGGAIPLEKPVINFFDRETADVALKQQLAMRALEFLEP